MNRPPKWMHDGVSCDYHTLIGGPVTAAGVVINGEPFKTYAGDWVVCVVGRPSYFAVEAFSRSEKAIG